MRILLNNIFIKRNDRVIPFSQPNIKECLICLDDLINPYKLNCCNAIYHKKCFYNWVNYSKTRKCLHCQQPLNELVRKTILQSHQTNNYKDNYILYFSNRIYIFLKSIFNQIDVS